MATVRPIARRMLFMAPLATAPGQGACGGLTGHSPVLCFRRREVREWRRVAQRLDTGWPGLVPENALMCRLRLA